MNTRHPLPPAALAGLCTALLSACASSTSFTVTPSPQAASCQRGGQAESAVVLWATQWRAEQKDVADREAAAQSGIDQFFKGTDCFARAEVRRLPDAAQAAEQAASAMAASRADKAVVIVVRELGPVLKLGSSAALVEGGTEVVLDLAVLDRANPRTARRFSAHWANGGKGVVKGVATLPQDMASALRASLQPEAR